MDKGFARSEDQRQTPQNALADFLTFVFAVAMLLLILGAMRYQGS
jgi:hypothetical protein